MYTPLLHGRLSRWLMGVLVLLGSLGAQAQNLINETFEAGTFGSFTVVNGTQTNKWFVGTAAGNGPTTAGTNAAYISDDAAGATYNYNINAASVAHLYQDVTIPAGQTVIQLSFDWKAAGEPCCDYLRVFLVPTSTTPVAGTVLATGQVGATFNQQGTAFARTTIVLPASAAGTTQRVVFSWRNDGSSGPNPPAALDNVVLSSQVPVPVCGNKTVGPTAGATYATLGAALTDVNLNGLCGPLVIELQPAYVSTVETFPLVYSATGTATNTVTVRPMAGATNLIINSAVAGPVFNIAGGDYLILDGRPGGSGTTVSGAATATDLTISSTSTSGIPLQFTSDATFNVAQHLQVKGMGTSDSGSPDINFTGTVTTTGNSDNTVQYCNIGDATATPVTLVYGGSSSNNRNSLLNNNLFNNYGTGSTYGIFVNQAGTGWVITGNSVYQTASRATVAGTMFGINVVGGTNHTISNNFIGGTAPSAGGTPLTTTGTMAYRFVGIQLSASGTGVQGNTVANINWASSSGASTANGVLAGIYVSGGNANIGTTTGNIIGTVAGPITTTSTTSGGQTFGISSASSGTVTIARSTISNISATGSAATIAANVTGILVSGGTTSLVLQNKVYSLSAGNAGMANGLWTSGGTSTTFANNLVGDLQAASSTSLVAINGLQVSGGTTPNAYFNTIYLNATSTGATFGTSGIYLNSTSTVLDARNNIVVNKSTAAGTGGYTVALRRVSGTAGTAPTNLASTTNNNLYYAGTPSATNLIYAEGTTTLTNAMPTLADYKTLVAPRESVSVTEDVAFVSTTGSAATYLHLNTTVPTQASNAGTPVTGITTDFDGDTRNATTPDIGADEGNFQSVDLTGPAIVYTALANTSSTGNRTLTVNITDASGVATGPSAPRLYFRKGTTGAFQFVNATTVSGSTYTFTFDFALVGGVMGNDVIQYYVGAQDLAATPNVATGPSGGTGTNPPGTTAPTTLSSFQILLTLSGNYFVGTSPHTPPASYATLTAAAAAYNANGLSGAVNFILIDPTYSTAETFPITFNANPDASATNRLSIKPEAGVSATITGSNSAELLLLNGADYVTIDGTNGGTVSAVDLRPSRNLTINNTNTGTTSAVLWGQTTAAGDAATNNLVKNLNVLGNTPTTTLIGIGFGGSSVGTSSLGTGNNNNTIQNNSVGRVQYGIYSSGAGATNKNTGTVITQNDLNSASPNNLGIGGIIASFDNGVQITQNAVSGIVGTGSPDVFGISAGFGINNVNTTSFTGSEVTNATISRNNIGVIRNTGTYGAVGIGLASAASGTSTIANNFVSGVSSNGTGGDFGAGIFVGGGTGSTTRIVYNSVSMTGTQTGSSTPSFALAIGGASPTVEIRNNILLNTQSTGANNIAVGFAYAGTAGAYAGLTSSHNDFFVGTGSTFAVGQTGSLSASGVLRTTLAALNTETGQDAPTTSKNVDPQFVSATDLHTQNVALNNAGTPITGITTDYDGETRNISTPDIGADEFTPQPTDVAANGLVAPAQPTTGGTCFGTAETVTVSIRNAGTTALNFATTPATITVVISGPGATTQTLTPFTLNTGTLAAGATQNVTLTGGALSTANLSAPGTYSFSITASVAGDGNTANNTLLPAPSIVVSAPVAGTLAPASTTICVSGTTALTLTGANNGQLQLQQSSSATGPFTNVSGATSATYTTPVLTATTYYRYQVTCGTTVVTSNVSTITVNNPQVASTNTPVTICSGQTATLTATPSAGASVRFFAAATGGTALTTTTAGTYTTPALTANTTYYAEAFTGGTETVGRPAPASTTSTTASNYGLVFNATSAFTLTSVEVYPAGAAGNLVVQVQDNTGTLISGLTATVAIPAGTGTTAFTVPLNFSIPAGTGMRLIAVSSPAMVREAAIGGFPYTSPSGLVNITNGYISGTSTTYYYFYNWQVSTLCVGAARTAIQVNIAPATPASFSYGPTSSFCTSQTTAQPVTLGTGSAAGTFTSAAGLTINASTGAITPSTSTPGTYTVTNTVATSGTTCANTAATTVTIAAPATASFTYPAPTPGSACAGTTGTIAATLGMGATAGTFSVAPASGLTLDTTTGAVNLATSTAGTYTVTNTVAASGGCAAVTSSQTLVVNPTPATPTLTQTTQANGSVLLTSSATTGNQFYLNGNVVPGATGQSYLVASSMGNGSYTVVATGTGGCASAASAARTVTVILGTRNALLEATLRVFPNPTLSGAVTLEISGYAKAATLTVSNVLGQEVSTQQLPASASTSRTIPVQLPAASGVYLLQVRTADGSQVLRVVRQ